MITVTNDMSNVIGLKEFSPKLIKQHDKLCQLFADFIVKLDFLIFDDQYNLNLYSCNNKILEGYFELNLRNKWQYDETIKIFTESKIFRSLLKRKYRHVFCKLKFTDGDDIIYVFDTRNYF